MTGIPALLLCLTPILVLPAIIGVIILRRADEGNRFARYAGWLTLKPVVTTPIWFLFLLSTAGVSYNTPEEIPPAVFLSILPGALLTVISVMQYQSLLFGEEARRDAWGLLVLDCLRWINSGLLMISPAYQQRIPLFDAVQGISSITGILLPTIFAIIALYLSRATRPLKAYTPPKDDWA